ncbi:hypothetical protein [Aestuariivirga litoralis]|uniref:hypothetical protein n=1 Tax=Aestuariivirga litoralis TaxID=2650924 RepID=UPI0018C5ABEF|nr:hypothetical protein [Aestuariivirga litoralis]MBG1232920.1 hypothetical protein [Aestuariivirga litoralis]
MTQSNKDIQLRLELIAKNEARIAELVAALWKLEIVDTESLRQEEYALRKQNAVYRREIVDLTGKKDV